VNYECNGQNRIIPTDKLVQLPDVFAALKHFAQNPLLFNIFLAGYLYVLKMLALIEHAVFWVHRNLTGGAASAKQIQRGKPAR
jgi:hypothetical protein